MRKGFLLGAGVAIAMAFSWASAQAQWFVTPSGPGALYFGVEGGWTSLVDTTNDGRFGNVSITRKFDSVLTSGPAAATNGAHCASEEEFSYANNQGSSVRLRHHPACRPRAARADKPLRADDQCHL